MLKNVRELKPTNLSHGKNLLKGSKIAKSAYQSLFFLARVTACALIIF
jgi:hypothetical protein